MSAAADVSVDVMELRAYVDGLQAMCCFGDQPVEITPSALLQLFAPVAHGLERIEARLTATG